MLATAAKKRMDALAYGITPKGSRPPFTRRYSPAETLTWWLQHRYDPLGMALVQNMTPMQVAQLDAWLTQASAHPSVEGRNGVPTLPGVQGVLTRALGQERRIQGPPVGPEVS